MRLARFARVRLLRHALPISLLILRKNPTVLQFQLRLQNSPYFCVFKYARAVKQKVWNEAENGERDWGERLKIRTVRFAYVIFVRITRFSPQSRSLFSASFQTFCLTARAYLNTQKYGLFCSLKLHLSSLAKSPNQCCKLSLKSPAGSG